jgi:hypothetical protein
VSGNDPNVAGDAVQAVFDNLLVDQDANGTSDLYDDFSASRLDLAKYYATGETVLVENQELSLAIGRNGFWDSRVVRLGNASVSRALAADIRVDEVATINGGVGRIGLIGTFFSGGGGTPGDATGDGLAIVGLDGTRAYAAVILMPFTTLGPAAVGETHTLFVEFDGSVLTMQLDDNVPLVFDPAGAGISNPQPPNAAFKGIEVAADNQAAGDGAFIRGAVDNVRTW